MPPPPRQFVDGVIKAKWPSSMRSGYVIFVWIYGIFYGGYSYCLKMYIYEKVRARNFARAWGFAQFSMAIPNAIGVPVVGYLTHKHGSAPGAYLSASCIIGMGQI